MSLTFGGSRRGNQCKWRPPSDESNWSRESRMRTNGLPLVARAKESLKSSTRYLSSYMVHTNIINAKRRKSNFWWLNKVREHLWNCRFTDWMNEWIQCLLYWEMMIVADWFRMPACLTCLRSTYQSWLVCCFIIDTRQLISNAEQQRT